MANLVLKRGIKPINGLDNKEVYSTILPLNRNQSN